MEISPIFLQSSFDNLVWVNPESMISLLIKFALDILMTFIIVRVIYDSKSRKNEYAFTYFVFNILIFFLCHLMANVELSIGFAFGLFALFSIMRYRTTTISIKEMTFLFAVVCIGVINSIYSIEIGILELLFINLVIVVSMYILNKAILKQQLHSQRILYERIDLVKNGKQELLLADLKERTGFNIIKFEIESTNFLNDSAFIWIYYDDADEYLVSTEVDVKKELQRRKAKSRPN